MAATRPITAMIGTTSARTITPVLLGGGGLFLLQKLLDPSGNGFAAFYLWPLGLSPDALGVDSLPFGIGFQPWQTGHSSASPGIISSPHSGQT